MSWGSGIYDFDNDGWLDILIFHGGLIHMVPQEQSLFRGLGNGKFADVSREAGPVLDVKTVSRGACFADYDNDGKVDAFVVNLGAPATLLHNVSAEQQSLAHREAEREEEQSRRHRRSPGIARRRPEADRGTRSQAPAISRRTMAASISAWARHPRQRSSPFTGPAARTRSWRILRSIGCSRWRNRRWEHRLGLTPASGCWLDLPASSQWLCWRLQPSRRRGSRQRFRKNGISLPSRWHSLRMAACSTWSARTATKFESLTRKRARSFEASRWAMFRAESWRLPTETRFMWRIRGPTPFRSSTRRSWKSCRLCLRDSSQPVSLPIARAKHYTSPTG